MDKELSDKVNQNIRMNIKELKETFLVEEYSFKTAYKNIEAILDIGVCYFKLPKTSHKDVGKLWQAITAQYFKDITLYMQTYGYSDFVDMSHKEHKNYFNRILKEYGGKDEQKTGSKT